MALKASKASVVLPVICLDVLEHSNSIDGKNKNSDENTDQHTDKKIDINTSKIHRLPTKFQSNQVDIIININMIHISPYSCTNALFKIANDKLKVNGIIMLYGPYKVCIGLYI
jgi:hypothetical protein